MLLMFSCHISSSFLIRTQLSGVAGCCQHIRQEVSLVEAGAGVSSPGSPWSSQVDSVVGPSAERWRRVAALRGVVRQRRDLSLVEVIRLLSEGGHSKRWWGS